jgi:putative ABC transport system permease protein
MLFWTIVRVSLKSLRANKLRSVLAMLGIIIGVWSVISALALAAGVKASITKTMSSLGTNLLTITPALNKNGTVKNTTQQTLKVADALALVGLPNVGRVTPVVRGNGQARYFNRNASTNLSGVAPTYFAVHDFAVARGRPLNDADCDAGARVCDIGPTTAKNLFGEDFAWGVGQSIGVNGVAYRVIGILAGKGDQGWFNPDDQILIPYTTAMAQVVGQTYLNEVDVSAADEAKLDAVQTEATLLLRRRHRLGPDADNDFNVRNQTEILKSAGDIQFFLSALLGGIAAISLLVGGIGVMNVMLVTVAERTREIGIRKAIGARRRDILAQFLIESVVMSTVGGAVGVLLGFATALAVLVLDHFTGWTLSLLVTPLSVLLAVAFSAGVGVFFGYYPARRAARLDPIEALRYE